MTLPIPAIDDRKFKDLMAEAISLIPRYNKEWTNYNPSDPGIALLEIFAWVSESVMYRADKIPEESYWKYFDLLGLGRKKKTIFTKELQTGEILVLGGEIRLVATLESDVSLTMNNSLEIDLDRPDIFFKVPPHLNGPFDVEIKNGKEIISQDLLELVSEGDIVIGEESELAVLKTVNKDNEYLELYRPFSSKIQDPENNIKISIVQTTTPERPAGHDALPEEKLNKVRVRGKHVLGDNTDFKSELQKSDLIIAGGRIRVVADIKSKNFLTVHIPFDEDIDNAVQYYYVRPQQKTGSVTTSSTKMIGYDKDEDLESARLRAIKYVSEPYRAVTVSDYEEFANKAIKGFVEGIGKFRVICLSNRNYEWTAIGKERPGHITIFLVIPFMDTYLDNRRNTAIYKVIDSEIIKEIEQGVVEGITDGIVEAVDKGVEKALSLNNGETVRKVYEQAALDILKRELINTVERDLDHRRIITTRIHAVFPEFKEIQIKASLIHMKGINPELAKSEAEKILCQFFDPITGGSQKGGWPLGRNLYVSEVYQVLEGIDAVDHVQELVIETDNDEESNMSFVELAEDEFIKLKCTITAYED